MGLTLFRRTRRQVELTHAGEAFLAGARRALAEVDRAVTAAHRAARGETGHLAIGFVGTATYELLPALLMRLRSRLPDLTLSLREMTTAQQTAALTAGEIDLGLLRPPLEPTGLATESVREERLVAVLPAAHPLAVTSEPLDLAQLAGEPFVLFPAAQGQGLYAQVTGACRMAGFHPRVVQEAVHMETLLALVAGGAGVTLAPASLQALSRPGVVYRPLTASPSLCLAAAWRQDDERPHLHRVLELLRQLPG